MNCQKGDLARVVPIDPLNEWLRGRIVRCTAPYPNPPAGMGATWIIEPAMTNPAGGQCIGIEDCILRPIRDPGDDARDETLEWLPVPMTASEVLRRQREWS